jgi:phospholipase/carboxylesterase
MMNRFQQIAVDMEPSVAPAIPTIPTAALDISGGVFSPATSPGITFFAPQHYESKYAYPLIVWLHGHHDDESQLKRIMPHVSLRNFVAVGVRGPVELRSSGPRPSFGWSQSPAHLGTAEQRIFDALELARSRYNIASDRVFIAGYDTGGTMALRVALAQPAPFAGVVSIEGGLPVDHAPLVRLLDARRVDVLLACGRDSDRYPTPTVCANLRLLHAAGMNVALRQYPGGHHLTDLMLADMTRWVMEQIAGVVA